MDDSLIRVIAAWLGGLTGGILVQLIFEYIFEKTAKKAQIREIIREIPQEREILKIVRDQEIEQEERYA